MHTIVTGIIEVDADGALDNRHGCLILAAVADIEDVLAGEIFLEETALDAALIAAGGLRPDISQLNASNGRSPGPYQIWREHRLLHRAHSFLRPS
jgi:hypothetical protein